MNVGGYIIGRFFGEPSLGHNPIFKWLNKQMMKNSVENEMYKMKTINGKYKTINKSENKLI